MFFIKWALIGCTLVHATYNHRQAELERTLMQPGCNRECVSYILLYFPITSLLEKCGCSSQTVETLPYSKQDLQFLPKYNDLSLVDPIVQLYLSKIQSFDAQIANLAAS